MNSVCEICWNLLYLLKSVKTLLLTSMDWNPCGLAADLCRQIVHLSTQMEHSQGLYQCDGHCLGRSDAVWGGEKVGLWQNAKSPPGIGMKLESPVYIYLLCMTAREVLFLDKLLSCEYRVNTTCLHANSQWVAGEGGWVKEREIHTPYL